MSEERDRILKMLEEGKVTAEQAARLIEALGSSGSERDEDRVIRVLKSGRGRHRHLFLGHPPRPPRIPMAELDRIPDIVASAVTSAMGSGFTAQEEVKTEFPGKRSLFLKSVSGDVGVQGWDKDRMSLEGSGGMTRVRERDDRVMVRSISGDVEVKVPHEARLELVSVSGDVGVSAVSGKVGVKSVSGDVSLRDVKGELDFDIVSGDLTMVRVGGELAVESKSGDVEFEPAGDFSGTIVSKSGDIELRLDAKADVVLDLLCEEDGDINIDLDMPFERLEEGEGRLKLKLGPGSRTMVVRTRKADINVKQTGIPGAREE